jgi:site-specific recombinase XerD
MRGSGGLCPGSRPVPGALDGTFDRGNLSRSYSRLRDLAGLPRDLVLYLARHECGTKICREKGIEYARRLLGHSDISTTQRYLHLDERELAEALV